MPCFNEIAALYSRPILQTPSNEAVLDASSNMRFTYAQVWERGQKLASYLANELNLGIGDVIAFCADSGIHYLDAFYAGLRIGTIITVYNCHLNGEDLKGLVIEEDPKVVFFQEKYRESVERFKSVGRADRVYVSIDGPGEHAYADIMRNAANLPLGVAAPAMDDIQMLVHTGGTTGRPKSAMLSFRSVFFNAVSEALSIELSARDCALIFFPFFHTAGWNLMTIPLLMLGGRVIVGCSLKASSLLAAIGKERPTVGVATEAIFLRMAAHPLFGETDFSCYRCLINGASPIARTNMEPYWRKGVKLFNAYGMTEIGPNNAVPPISSMTLDEVKRRWNSVGKPMFFNQVRIVDAEGNDCAAGEDGELLWRGNLTFSGYWKNPEASAGIRDAEGWVASGDVGHFDDNGYIYLSGRLKNMIISGGENIFPIEIENAFKAHPAIADCVVVGAPDPNWGEVPKILVVLEPGFELTREQLLSYGKGCLPTIKVPKYVAFLDEIPRKGFKAGIQLLRQRYGCAGDGLAGSLRS